MYDWELVVAPSASERAMAVIVSGRDQMSLSSLSWRRLRVDVEVGGRDVESWSVEQQALES